MLWTFQQDLVDQVHYHIAEGYQRLLLYAPTGSGKTVMAVQLMLQAEAQGQRCLFVVRQDPLVAQTIAKLAHHQMTCGVIKAGYPEDLNAPIQVASVQTLNRRRRSWPEADWVILDEAHGTTARQYDGLFLRYDGAIILGPTATPFRLSRKQPLSNRYEIIVAGPQTADLIQQGYLVKPIVYGYPPEQLDLQTVHTVAGDYCRQEIAIRCNTDDMIAMLVQEWRRVADQRRTLAFAVNRAHAQHMATAFSAAGISADYIDGETPSTDRQLKYARLRSGQTLVLANCAVLAEGFDEPTVEALILARPTKSKALYLQQVGRGLRISPETGKTNCVIIDQAGNAWRLGLPTDPLLLSLEGQLEHYSGLAPIKRCPECYHLLPAGATICPECHYRLSPPQSLRSDLPVTLDIIREQPVDRKVIRLMLKLKQKQESSGYRPGWVYFAFVKQHKHPTLPELQVLAQLLGYEPGWAWYRWRDLNRYK